MSDKEFTLEISGNNIYCSRPPEKPEEWSLFYEAVLDIQCMLQDDLLREAIEKGIKEGGIS